jgi:hypothetical protein
MEVVSKIWGGGGLIIMGKLCGKTELIIILKISNISCILSRFVKS